MKASKTIGRIWGRLQRVLLARTMRWQKSVSHLRFAQRGGKKMRAYSNRSAKTCSDIRVMWRRRRVWRQNFEFVDLHSDYRSQNITGLWLLTKQARSNYPDHQVVHGLTRALCCRGVAFTSSVPFVFVRLGKASNQIIKSNLTEHVRGAACQWYT